METKQYHNNDITVIWEPAKCIHSGICFRGLPQVFDPRKKPWITLETQSTEAIINQVKSCPSGAISFKYKKEIAIENSENKEQINLLKVQVSPGGPLLLHGNFILDIDNSIQPIESKVTALCRCGQSNNKPFCDGSHQKVSFDKK